MVKWYNHASVFHTNSSIYAYKRLLLNVWYQIVQNKFTLNSTRFQCWNNDYSILNMWLKYVFTLKSTWIQLQLLVEIMLIKHWINIDSTLIFNVESTFGFQRWYKFSKSNIISTLNQHRKPTLNQCWVPAGVFWIRYQDVKITFELLR
jgi:hypothetical protein